VRTLSEGKAFVFSIRERELLLKTVTWVADLLPELLEDPGYSQAEQELHLDMLTFCKNLIERLKEAQ
jgi:hypothetical protein